MVDSGIYTVAMVDIYTVAMVYIYTVAMVYIYTVAMVYIPVPRPQDYFKIILELFQNYFRIPKIMHTPSKNEQKIYIITYIITGTKKC